MSAGPSQSPSPSNAEAARAIDDLPRDELRRYGRELGLEFDETEDLAELRRRVGERRTLLATLNRDEMLEVVVWGRRPVRRSAGKEELARKIAAIQRTDYDRLSPRGRRVLAALRGFSSIAGRDDDAILKYLKSSENLWHRVKRVRRRVVGSIIARVFEQPAEEGEYRFLPEEEGGRAMPPLKEEIAERGLMGGIANRLRGVADDYIRDKLDEIEQRIDQKLEEIDKRLGEWRDREVAARLRILRVTLAASVLFAIVSLGYHVIRGRIVEPTSSSTTQASRTGEQAARPDAKPEAALR